MAYTIPRTWGAGEVATAAMLNTNVRDNTLWLASVHGAELYKSADQTGIADTTRTVLTWDSEYYDTDGFHDPVTNNSRITVPAGFAGYFRFICQITWDSNATGFRKLAYRTNNDNTATGVRWYSVINPPTGSFSQLLLGDLFLNVGDYVEAVVYQNSGGNRTVFAANTWDGTNTVSSSLLAVQFLGF